jgi:hypothetical protein
MTKSPQKYSRITPQSVFALLKNCAFVCLKFAFFHAKNDRQNGQKQPPLFLCSYIEISRVQIAKNQNVFFFNNNGLIYSNYRAQIKEQKTTSKRGSKK